MLKSKNGRCSINIVALIFKCVALRNNGIVCLPARLQGWNVDLDRSLAELQPASGSVCRQGNESASGYECTASGSAMQACPLRLAILGDGDCAVACRQESSIPPAPQRQYAAVTLRPPHIRENNTAPKNRALDHLLQPPKSRCYRYTRQARCTEGMLDAPKRRRVKSTHFGHLERRLLLSCCCTW